MKIVTTAEMRAIDRATSERFGVSGLRLMENAGAAVADFVAGAYVGAQRIFVVCGKGNNGGDGFAAARKLCEMRVPGQDITVLLAGERSEVKGDAAAMLAKVPVEVRCVVTGQELSSILPARTTDPPPLMGWPHVIIDALLGSGIRLPVTGLYADAIAAINDAGGPVVSVDVPSGADADVTLQSGLMVRADAVITFTAPRTAHVLGSLTQGRIVVAQIGSPPEAVETAQTIRVITPFDIAGLVAPRKHDSNKGNYGHVLTIGGSQGKSGAAAMAGMAALRAGAGLSTVAGPRSVLETIAGFHPELMTEPLPETAAGTISGAALQGIQAIRSGKSVLAIGPGISRDTETAEFARKLIAGCADVPVVLDADGLNSFEKHTNELSGEGRTLVITPHPGEMARLAGCSIAEVQADRMGVAREFAAVHNVIVVLKGHRTVVATPDGEAWINVTGNPGMATGGTGDILTGTIAGLMAQSPRDALAATLAGVYLHGLAGDVMSEKLGEHSMVATDLLGGLAEAFRRTARAVAERMVSWAG